MSIIMDHPVYCVLIGQKHKDCCCAIKFSFKLLYSSLIAETGAISKPVRGRRHSVQVHSLDKEMEELSIEEKDGDKDDTEFNNQKKPDSRQGNRKKKAQGEYRVFKSR